jgi:hypothetical protein
MGVGNLNVSVTAETRAAIANLRSFRDEIGATGSAAAKAGRDFQGFGINELAARFAAVQPNSAAIKAAATALDNYRFAVVDLTRDVDRYAKIADKASTVTGLIKESSKAIAFVGKAIGVSGVVVQLTAWGYQLAVNEGQWAKWGKSVGEWLGVVAKEGERADEILGAKLDAQLARIQEERRRVDEERKAADAAFKERLRDAEFDAREAGGWKVDRQFGRDVEQFGEARAIRLSQMREQAEEIAAQEAEKRRQTEEQIAAIDEKRRRWDEAREQKRKNHVEDAKTVAELEKEVANFWKSPEQKRRDEIIGSIEDWKQREQANYALLQLEAAERVKAGRENARAAAELRRSRGGIAPFDARTVEGWAALRSSIKASSAQENLLGVGQQQLGVLNRIDQRLAGANQRGADTFDPFANP